MDHQLLGLDEFPCGHQVLGCLVPAVDHQHDLRGNLPEVVVQWGHKLLALGLNYNVWWAVYQLIPLYHNQIVLADQVVVLQAGYQG